MPADKARTIRELRSSGHRVQTVKEEMRRNLIAKIRADEDLFPGIIGFEETVIPQLENAILSGQDIIFLGERGQANSRLITDEHPFYHGISRYLPHDTVEHQQAYVMGEDIHTQGIENFWSLLKRGLIGTFHHVQAKYLECYVDEFSFRFNARRMTDEERFASALANAHGRLTWFFGQASQGESRSAS